MDEPRSPLPTSAAPTGAAPARGRPLGAPGRDRGFIPTGPPRLPAESVAVRLIASAGVVGIGTLLGAVLGATDVAAWLIGLVVSLVSLVIAAVLWRSRRL
jgi:hypothetical protein